MDLKPSYSATDVGKWREWLIENHDKQSEVWLVYFKKHTGIPSVSYRESVEQAICFGWIDGIKKRIDDSRYTHRFSPRRPDSRWSDLNIRLAEKMIKEGQMTEAGLLKFQNRKSYDDIAEIESQLEPELESVFKSNKVAWENFNGIPKSHKKRYLGWIQSAKKQETKLKRLAEAISMLEKGKGWE